MGINNYDPNINNYDTNINNNFNDTNVRRLLFQPEEEFVGINNDDLH